MTSREYAQHCSYRVLPLYIVSTYTPTRTYLPIYSSSTKFWNARTVVVIIKTCTAIGSLPKYVV
jgi:hypothetical protein